MTFEELLEINERYLDKFCESVKKIEQLEKQKQKVIALIKDGRFVEALQELEND